MRQSWWSVCWRFKWLLAPSAFEDRADALEVHRFEEMFVETSFEDPFAVVESRQRNEANRLAQLATNAASNSITVEDGHSDFQHHDIRFPCKGGANAIQTVVGLLNGVPRRLQHLA